MATIFGTATKLVLGAAAVGAVVVAACIFAENARVSAPRTR